MELVANLILCPNGKDQNGNQQNPKQHNETSHFSSVDGMSQQIRRRTHTFASCSLQFRNTQDLSVTTDDADPFFVRCGNDGAEKNSDGIADRKEARKGKAKG